MSRAVTDHPDLGRARLRTVLAAIEAELGDARPHAWKELVDLLALGPAPEIRTCPSCSRVIMRAATKCGHCWRALPPA